MEWWALTLEHQLEACHRWPCWTVPCCSTFPFAFPCSTSAMFIFTQIKYLLLLNLRSKHQETEESSCFVCLADCVFTVARWVLVMISWQVFAHIIVSDFWPPLQRTADQQANKKCCDITQPNPSKSVETKTVLWSNASNAYFTQTIK